MTAMRATIHVPGSTSNLGGGFDCVGMAVNRWLTATVVIDESRMGVTMSRAGSLASLTCDAADDLLHTGFHAACTRAGRA